MPAEQSERPWIVPVAAAEIADDGSHYELAPEPAVRDAVMKLAGLRALPMLEATFDLTQQAEGIAVRGEVRAQVGQTCVVTLEPIENEVREVVDILFAAGDDADNGETPTKRRGEPPERIENGIVDLGAIATEFLILGLDPYPRKPGVEFSGTDVAEEGARPFAALASLKKTP